ncbi:MAG TPA: hypothetical protein VMF60_07540, partial [Acidimicrobiales bacterium]|nr:hypothetical protein [Acidimicrobiales bacterium]
DVGADVDGVADVDGAEGLDALRPGDPQAVASTARATSPTTARPGAVERRGDRSDLLTTRVCPTARRCRAAPVEAVGSR